MKPKELLEKYLKQIGWSLRPYGCEHYTLCDHKGHETSITFWDNTVECKENNVICSFKITKNSVKLPAEDNFVSIGTNNHFILLMNHDK